VVVELNFILLSFKVLKCKQSLMASGCHLDGKGLEVVLRGLSEVLAANAIFAPSWLCGLGQDSSHHIVLSPQSTGLPQVEILCGSLWLGDYLCLGFGVELPLGGSRPQGNG
jgi:hypothetical protein